MGKVVEFPARSKRPVSRNQLVTVGDLEDFKTDLLLAIKHLLTYEVKKLLGISEGTLQSLRNNGTLPFSKVGNIIYYSQEDIDNMIADRQDLISSGPLQKRRI